MCDVHRSVLSCMSDEKASECARAGMCAHTRCSLGMCCWLEVGATALTPLTLGGTYDIAQPYAKHITSITPIMIVECTTQTTHMCAKPYHDTQSLQTCLSIDTIIPTDGSPTAKVDTARKYYCSLSHKTFRDDGHPSPTLHFGKPRLRAVLFKMAWNTDRAYLTLHLRSMVTATVWKSAMAHSNTAAEE